VGFVSIHIRNQQCGTILKQGLTGVDNNSVDRVG
jgi:hypothetical protein